MLYASYSDWRRREVSDKVWVIWAPLAFILTISQYVLFAQEFLHFYALSFIVTSALSILLFYLGAFGGADAKALICLSIALPEYPIHLLKYQLIMVSPLPFAITVFINAVLMATLTVFYNVLRNILWRFKTNQPLFEGLEGEPPWRKSLVFFSGYKVQTTELAKSVHFYPLEDVTPKGEGDERRLLTLPKDQYREEIIARILHAAERKKIQNEVWATPGLPLLVFITAGLIVALALGDLIWILVWSILKI